MSSDVLAAIPHRPPFLLVDSILEKTADSIRVAYRIRPDDELWSRIYAGHYPGGAITPGVLLCEMIFQAAAVLAADLARGANLDGVPMVTRITGAKFKAPVYPGDALEIRAELRERVANAFFMRGSVLKDGKKAVEAEFAVALARPAEREGGK